MPSNHEAFWRFDTYAVIGNSAGRAFPVLTYRGLKKLGKTVYPVDPAAKDIDGDMAYPDLSALPGPVEAAVVEVHKAETKGWVEKIAEHGLKDVWLHMSADTPEALELAEKSGINARTGTCAVMYVTPGFTFHSVHKFLRKLSGKY